jgi:hypothetical protein
MANTTAPIAVNIPPGGFLEIEEIAKHSAKLGMVVSSAKRFQIDSPLVARNAAVAAEVGIDPETATLLLSGLSNLRTLMEQLEVGPHSLLEAVTIAIQMNPPQGGSNKIFRHGKARLTLWRRF